MFISLSKTLAKFGGVRLGVGMRATKKNAPYIAIFAAMMMLFKSMWYMMIICFWLVYATIYGIIWLCRKSTPFFKELFQKLYEKTEQNTQKKNQA